MVAIAAAKAAGFPVYVIGIGPSTGNLDKFAVAGGTTNYFPATSPQAMTDAFASISKAVTEHNSLMEVYLFGIRTSRQVQRELGGPSRS